MLFVIILLVYNDIKINRNIKINLILIVYKFNTVDFILINKSRAYFLRFNFNF